MFGTMVLTLVGCGVAVLTGSVVATAFAFGLAIVAMAYCIGDRSGCHINPAVSLALRVDDRIDTKTMIFYWIFQFLGGIIGAGLLYYIVIANDMTIVNNAGVIISGLGTNGFVGQGDYDITMAGAIVVEIILTMIFTLTVLGVTQKQKTAAQAGIVIGGSLTFVHLIGINLTGTSVNPARSLGPAIFLAVAGTTIALEQVWIFVLAPLVGALIAGFLYKYVFKTEA